MPWYSDIFYVVGTDTLLYVCQESSWGLAILDLLLWMALKAIAWNPGDLLARVFLSRKRIIHDETLLIRYKLVSMLFNCPVFFLQGDGVFCNWMDRMMSDKVWLH
jgi:hypothetical protein